jgi:hypothetical protein
MSDFSDFMEVFTVTHLTYVCIFPCFVSFFGVVFLGVGDIFSLMIGNVGMYIFLFVILLLGSAKVFDKFDEVPYFDARMEQFEGGTNEFE